MSVDNPRTTIIDHILIISPPPNFLIQPLYARLRTHRVLPHDEQFLFKVQNKYRAQLYHWKFSKYAITCALQNQAQLKLPNHKPHKAESTIGEIGKTAKASDPHMLRNASRQLTDSSNPMTMVA